MAQEYIKERMAEIDTLNFELQKSGQSAISSALKKLTELTKRDERRVRSETTYNDAGKPTAVITYDDADLEAAKALAKFGIDALKLARSGSAKAETSNPENDDLFDAARKNDPWKLRNLDNQ